MELGVEGKGLHLRLRVGLEILGLLGHLSVRFCLSEL